MHNNLCVMSVGRDILKTDANLFGMNQSSRRRFHRKRVVKNLNKQNWNSGA